MSARPHLVALPGYADRPEPDVLFCGPCGSHASADGPVPASRVCGMCGLGLLIGGGPGLVPREGEAFLPVARPLPVCGGSRRAGALPRVKETEAVDRRITDVLMPADCEVAGAESLVHLIAHAARGEGDGERVVVRPAHEFGIRFWASIGPCGPPKGALVVLRDGLR